MGIALRLSTREQRKKLAPRDKPYFHELRRGLALGYRRGSEGGSWLLREFRAGRYVQRRLGAADDDVQADGVSVLSWSDAQTAALGSDRPTVTKPGKLLVREAWEDYCQTRATPPDAREHAVWAQFVEPQLGNKPVGELTTAELERWLASQVTEYGERRDGGESDQRERRRRAQYTANRRFNLLRAILNSAYRKDPARVPSADAWRRVRAFQRVDRPRTRTLTAAQARRLLEVLQPPLRELARAGLLSGIRLGELEALRASDIASNRIEVRHGKSGRARWVPLNREGATFFASLVRDKAPDAAVLERMRRMDVSRQMRSACKAAEIDPPATFHDLRRSYGSLMLNDGAPIEVIQEVLGHADSRMTRRTYSHLLQQTVARAVQKHLPSFEDVKKPKRKRHSAEAR